jgi:hypothetical protein
MTKQNFSKQRIEEILNSFDNTQPVAAPDFFYTRLTAKMQQNLSVKKTNPVWKPVFFTAFLCLFLFVNVFSLRQLHNGNRVKTEKKEATPVTIDDFADAYNL